MTLNGFNSLLSRVIEPFQAICVFQISQIPVASSCGDPPNPVCILLNIPSHFPLQHTQHPYAHTPSAKRNLSSRSCYVHRIISPVIQLTSLHFASLSFIILPRNPLFNFLLRCNSELINNWVKPQEHLRCTMGGKISQVTAVLTPWLNSLFGSNRNIYERLFFYYISLPPHA